MAGIGIANPACTWRMLWLYVSATTTAPGCCKVGVRKVGRGVGVNRGMVRKYMSCVCVRFRV